MKGAGSDIDNNPPPPILSVTQAVNSSLQYKHVKYHFQERKNACSCVSSFTFPQLRDVARGE